MRLRLGGGLPRFLLFPTATLPAARRSAMYLDSRIRLQSQSSELSFYIVVCGYIHILCSCCWSVCIYKRQVFIHYSFQGPCCTTDCRLRFGDKCRDDNGCRDASFCDGRAPYCPPSINKPNKTICNQELVCFMGVSCLLVLYYLSSFRFIVPAISSSERKLLFTRFSQECTGSICLAYGLESCQCIPGPDDPATKACELCCRLPGENQPCL